MLANETSCLSSIVILSEAKDLLFCGERQIREAEK